MPNGINANNRSASVWIAFGICFEIVSIGELGSNRVRSPCVTEADNYPVRSTIFPQDLGCPAILNFEALGIVVDAFDEIRKTVFGWFARSVRDRDPCNANTSDSVVLEWFL